MRAVLCAVVSICLGACAALAATTSFPGGRLDVDWTGDASLSIRVVLDAVPESGTSSPMWVVTVNAMRFSDGIHSWQLHLSAAHGSIIVIPNDFLVAQRFTLDQLGVGVTALEPGKSVELAVPRSGAIPELVVPGDTIEVHALWIQQAPLARVQVPDVPAFATAGGGAASTESQGCVPARSVFVQGAPIRHAFSLLDVDTGAAVDWGAATVALVRVCPNLPDEIIRYVYREPDPATGTISYEFDTLNLVPGPYELIVWVNPPGATVRHRIEVVSSSP